MYFNTRGLINPPISLLLLLFGFKIKQFSSVWLSFHSSQDRDMAVNVLHFQVLSSVPEQLRRCANLLRNVAREKNTWEMSKIPYQMKSLSLTPHHFLTPWHLDTMLQKQRKSESAKAGMCFSWNLLGTQIQISTLNPNLDKWSLERQMLVQSHDQKRFLACLQAE